MSYSYIKSVFPNFENLNKVYDESLYSNLQRPLASEEVPQESFLQKVKVQSEVSLDGKVSNDNNTPLSYSNSSDFSSSTFEKEPIQNNLRFYNTPISESIKNIQYKNINPYEAYNKSDEFGASLTTEPTEITGTTGTTGTTGSRELERSKSIFTDDVVRRQGNQEKFEQDDLNCDVYIKHVVDCRRCRDMISRQFNLYDNEEMMEIISYLIFGLFILLVINSLKK